jgi:ribonuclease R
MITPPAIVDYLRHRSHHAVTLKTILSHFNLPTHERRFLKRMLGEMVEEGIIVKVAGNRYKIPSQRELVTGKVQKFEEGFGFVRPEEPGMPDLFLPPRAAHGIVEGDRVLARVDRRGPRPSGSVVRVLERAHQRIVGKIQRYKRVCMVHPFETRGMGPVTVAHGSDLDAPEGKVVVVEITNYPTEQAGAFGRVVEVLGDPEDPDVEFRIVAIKHGLPVEFPPDAEQEAGAAAQHVHPEEIAGREDLRALPIVTIDGETARDFDDAVCVRELPGGGHRLWVSIADVAHYVPERTAIDREAYARGTSVYFPDRAIPMLPVPLSSGICSLNPGEDRLALTAEMDFDAAGVRRKSRIYESVIRSHARMTYTEVAAILDRSVAGQAAAEPHGLFAQEFKRMEALALKLLRHRMEKGSIDFDLPEAEVILDVQGRTEDIVKRQRNIAHRLIEEFMLEANRAVAEFLTDRRAPLLYRVHERPDAKDLEAFGELALSFGLHFDARRGVRPRDLAEVLRAVKGRAEENLINQVMLRSMKQAKYTPENAGHFGLAFDTYCHFTSPIRRYPDLTVHRVLKEVLGAGGLHAERTRRLQKALPEWGLHTSRRERVAMDAEREIVALKKAQFMKDKVGEEYEGHVSGVVKFGFFVELRDFFVEGLVPMRTLDDDEYLFNERLHSLVGRVTRRRIRLGDPVRVRVDAVDVERRMIDFSLVALEATGPIAAGPPARRAAPPRAGKGRPKGGKPKAKPGAGKPRPKARGKARGSRRRGR